MPRQRHGRRHSVVAYGTGVKPPKPGVSRYWLIDFTLPTPSPVKLYPLSAMRELLCAVGVVPTRVYPKSGRISALAGRQGRLRACMRDVQWFLLAFISSQVLNCQLLNRGGPSGVPIQWLTTAHKIPCVRGDGSRSGPSPCQTSGVLKGQCDILTATKIKM